MSGSIRIQFTVVDQIASRRDIAITSLMPSPLARSDHCQTRSATVAFTIRKARNIHATGATKPVDEALTPIAGHTQAATRVINESLCDSDNTGFHGSCNGKRVTKAARMDVPRLIGTIAFTKSDFDPERTGTSRNSRSLTRRFIILDSSSQEALLAPICLTLKGRGNALLRGSYLSYNEGESVLRTVA